MIFFFKKIIICFSFYIFFKSKSTMKYIHYTYYNLNVETFYNKTMKIRILFKFKFELYISRFSIVSDFRDLKYKIRFKLENNSKCFHSIWLIDLCNSFYYIIYNKSSQKKKKICDINFELFFEEIDIKIRILSKEHILCEVNEYYWNFVYVINSI